MTPSHDARPVRTALRRGAAAFLTLGAVALAGCSGGDADADAGAVAEAEPQVPGVPSELAENCAPDDGGITLPDGFCAIVASEGVGPGRHIVARSDGVVFVALRNRRDVEGGVVALRDTDGDGTLDESERWGVTGGTGLAVDGETVYFAPDDAVLRYTVPMGSLTPTAGPDTIVSGLPAASSHAAKTIALGPDGLLYVNVGAPSNACMEESRTEGSPGMDPCPELEERGGIWRFDPSVTGQTQADGTRFATGLRNVVAMETHPETGQLYGVQHGRDQLHDLFPDQYTVEENAEKPAEEFVAIDEGDDFGWPYCYFDPALDRKVLAPEYGGDGEEVGRCAEAEDPLIPFPAHWAPNDLAFYTGEQFPGDYHDGAFIAFHGSWNRAPLPQEGYNVVFARFVDGRPTGQWEEFAQDFRRPDPEGVPQAAPEGETGRPTGVAVGPDGSLWIVDSLAGRIWRVVRAQP